MLQHPDQQLWLETGMIASSLMIRFCREYEYFLFLPFEKVQSLWIYCSSNKTFCPYKDSDPGTSNSYTVCNVPFTVKDVHVPSNMKKQHFIGHKGLLL